VDIANRKVAQIAEIQNGHFATVEDLLFGITVSLVDDRNEVQVTSVSNSVPRASPAEFAMTNPARPVSFNAE
jgi:hypothetical protein